MPEIMKARKHCEAKWNGGLVANALTNSLSAPLRRPHVYVKNILCLDPRQHLHMKNCHEMNQNMTNPWSKHEKSR